MNRARKEQMLDLFLQQQSIVDRLRVAERDGNVALVNALQQQLEDVQVMAGVRPVVR
jgi:hypothetical protein